MNEWTVNIADFRGIREVKPRNGQTTSRSFKRPCGFVVLESTPGRVERVVEMCGYENSAVLDIGMVRETQHSWHRSTSGPSTFQRRAKVLRFKNAGRTAQSVNPPVDSASQIWNGISDDPMDCPPAA